MLNSEVLNPTLDLENLFTQDAKKIFDTFLKATDTPAAPGKKLIQTGLDINRWYPIKKMKRLRDLSSEFPSGYSGLVEIGRVNQVIWGEDANVIGHSYRLLDYMRRTYPGLFQDGFGNLMSHVTILHDAAELFLEPKPNEYEDGDEKIHPRIADYVTGTKSLKVKKFENEKLREIVYSLPVHDFLKDFILGGCNKQGRTGKFLSECEKGLFVESSKNVTHRMGQLKGKSIPYTSYQGEIKFLRGKTLDKLFEITEETSSECLHRIRNSACV